MNPVKLFAVTGAPVLHSKSPLIFNSLFRELAIDAVYTRLAAHKPLEALFLSRKLSLCGMNVTAPFKESIMTFLDSVDQAADTIGAVNTIVRETNRLRGYNTDHIGVTESLKKENITISGKKCAVLGAGGAGRAAAYGLTKEGGDVTLVNRTYEKAFLAAAHLGCRSERISSLETLLQKAEIFVSTLAADVDIIPQEWLHAGLVILDANYKKSPLSAKAEAVGCRLLKGEEWLLNQAIPAFRLFFFTQPAMEIPPPVLDSIRRSILAPTVTTKPKNISLVGFMGSGKSAIGRALAAKMGFTFLDVDEYIEKQAGLAIPEIFKNEGESGFRTRETAALNELLTRQTGMVFGCGGGAILRPENRDLLHTHSLTVWLYATIKTTLRRVPPGTRPLLDVENPTDTAREILTGRLPSYARAADMVVSSENRIEEVAEKIYEEIGQTFKD